MPMTSLGASVLVLFAGAALVSTGVLVDDTVDIHVSTRDARNVSISVRQTDSLVWRTTLPCRTINAMPMENMVGMVRGYAQDAFEQRVKSKSKRDTFADMMRLQTGAAVRQASAICNVRRNNSI